MRGYQNAAKSLLLIKVATSNNSELHHAYMPRPPENIYNTWIKMELQISIKELRISAINCRYLLLTIKCENGLP